jgi:hypothetical protein
LIIHFPFWVRSTSLAGLEAGAVCGQLRRVKLRPLKAV